MITLAELASGPVAARCELERARREAHLRRVEVSIEALPFGFGCAHAYTTIYQACHGIGRKPRGGRAFDLLIAATALAYRLPMYTLNAADLRGLDDLIEVVDLGLRRPI